MRKKTTYYMIFSMIAYIMFGSGATVKAAPATELTGQYQYDIGSTSKMFGAAAVMKLAEEGLVDLDEPITTYIPEFKMADERYKKITVRMLLNHSSGLQGCHYDDMILFNDKDTSSKDTLLKRMQKEVLKSEPGEHAVYSNDGFTLVEFLVEHVSGLSFTKYIEQEFCTPLSMSRTGSLESIDKMGMRARNFKNHSMEYPFENCTVISSGGMWSTTEDLCRFGTLFLKNSNSLLSEESKAAFRKEEDGQLRYTSPTDLGETGFGLGWDEVHVPQLQRYGIQAMSKGGDIGFQHANLTVVPDKDMAAATLISGGSSEFNQQVCNALLLAALEVEGELKKEEDTTMDEVTNHYAAVERKEIEAEYLSFAGNYGWNTFYTVAFPEKNTMRIEAVQEGKEVIQLYEYIGDGTFVGSLGNILQDGDFSSAGEGKNGISKLVLREEVDGEKYIYSVTNTAYTGFDMGVRTSACGKKLEENPISKRVEMAWSNRNGKYYYLMSDKYSSTNWNTNPILKMKMGSLEGYMENAGFLNATKIVDENHAEPFALFRDTSDIELTSEHGVEYADIKNIGVLYANEAVLEPFPEQTTTYQMKREKRARWFSISEKESNQQVVIEADDNAAVYVYDKYHEVIYSTYILNGNHTVILPKDGTVAFIGEKGSKMNITYR